MTTLPMPTKQNNRKKTKNIYVYNINYKKYI